MEQDNMDTMFADLLTENDILRKIVVETVRVMEAMHSIDNCEPISFDALHKMLISQGFMKA